AGGTYAVTNLGDEPQQPPARPVAATVAVHNQRYTNIPFVVQNAQYVRVSGLGDPAIERRVNQLLRAPLDEAIEYVRSSTSGTGGDCTQTARLSSTAQIGLRTPSLISAVYTHEAELCAPADGRLPGRAVTVDLRTGRVLGPEDVFKPAMFTTSALNSLWGRMNSRLEYSLSASRCNDFELERRDFLQANQGGAPSGLRQPAATVFLAPDGFEINWAVIGSACEYDRMHAPYSSVRDMLKPELLARIPAAGPSPQRS
ncbi:hypothetical protein ACFQ07_27920, partial [Actinomadura adrarensis]